MSRTQRFALLAVAVAVAAAAFVIAQPGDDDKPATTSEAADTAPAEKPGQTAPTATTRSPESLATRIEVADVAPVGGVKKISVKKGDRIRFSVQSADTSDEVHLHGYDIMKDLSPGHPVRFDVPATIEGGFEIELEEAKVPIGQVTVEPR